MEYHNLNAKNFVLYAAKHYDNPGCESIEEFHDDLNRFKYIKRLFTKYQETGEIKERLVLNHLIALYNLFGAIGQHTVINDSDIELNSNMVDRLRKI